MAAGLSLEEENVAAFRQRLNEACMLTEEDFVPILYIDALMPMDYPTIGTARQMDALEPFGVGNPKPVFAQKDVRFYDAKPMGKNGQYGRFQACTPNGKRVGIVYFGDFQAFLNWLDGRFGAGSKERLLAGRGDFPISVAYQLGINSYHGSEDLQFLMKSYQ